MDVGRQNMMFYPEYYDTGNIPKKWIDGKEYIALSDAKLVADALNMWGCVASGLLPKLPDKFGEVLVEVSMHLKMEFPATGEGFIEYAYATGILVREPKENSEKYPKPPKADDTQHPPASQAPK